MSIKKKKSGFTLMEIIIVIVVVGVSTTLVLPRFTATFERVRASEGVQLLTALLGAQKTFEFENGAYAADPNDLDIQITRADNFDVGSIAVQNNPANVASIRRFGAYVLSIDEDGVISCANQAPNDFTCAQAGY